MNALEMEVQELKQQVAWLAKQHKMDQIKIAELNHVLMNLHGQSAAEVIFNYVDQVTSSQVIYNELVAKFNAKGAELATYQDQVRHLTKKIDKIKLAVFGTLDPQPKENPDGK